MEKENFINKQLKAYSALIAAATIKNDNASIIKISEQLMQEKFMQTPNYMDYLEQIDVTVIELLGSLKKS